MSFQEFAGCILRGPEAAKPVHATYLTDYKYEALDTGNVYYDNGSAWVLLSGAEKAETIKNKIVNFDNNTINGVLRDPFSTNKRFGYIIPAITQDACLNVALKGLPSVSSVNAYSLFFDPVKGYVSRFSMSAIEQAGWYSSVTPFITRREYNPYLKIEMRTSVTANMACWAGFTSMPIQLTGNAPLPNLAHGFVFSGGSGFSANYYTVRNDGANDSGAHVTMNVARDTNYHIFELFLSESGAPTMKLDGTSIVIPNSRLPGLTVDLMLYIHYWSRDTVPKTWDVVRAYFESDVI